VAEPTVVAVDQHSGDVAAFGKTSLGVIGRSPGYLQLARPVQRGVVTDPDLAGALFAQLIGRSGLARGAKPSVLASVPVMASARERLALEHACQRAGAGDVELVEQPLAAAWGLGLDLAGGTGCLVIDVGAGVTEAAIVCLNAVMASRSARIGGFDFDAALVELLRAGPGLCVGERTAERLKVAIATTGPLEEERFAEIWGRDVATGAARSVVVASSDVRPVVEPLARAVVDVALRCVAMAPPELAQDLIDGGVYLVGAGAQLPGLAEQLATALALPVQLAVEPETAGLAGLASRLRARPTRAPGRPARAGGRRRSTPSLTLPRS
jgi:rod shape-determining protein MreB